jgi:hypothetical protein
MTLIILHTFYVYKGNQTTTTKQFETGFAFSISFFFTFKGWMVFHYLPSSKLAKKT